MRIAMILLGTGFPPDIRVEKEAGALLAAGHEIVLLCERQAGEKEWEQVSPGFDVFRIPAPENTLRDRFLRTIALREPGYEPAIAEFLERVRPDVVHVHDLPFGPSVLAVTQKLRIPAVADLHENMPAAYAAYRAAMPSLKRRLHAIYRNYRRLRAIEKKYLEATAHTLVVVPEAATRIVEDYGIPPEKVTVVGNTEDADMISTGAIDPSVRDRFSGQWVALYTGGYAVHRGLDTAVRALSHVGDRIPNFKLVLVGAANDRDRRELEDIARRSGLADNLEIVPWVPRELVSSFIAAASVCLVPHADFEHTQTTIPHKLFQYMALGKPVLVSDCAPLKRVVETAGCGKIFRAGDASDFAEKLIDLYRQSPEATARMSACGQAAVRGDFAWRHDARRLLDVYESIGKYGPS